MKRSILAILCLSASVVWLLSCARATQVIQVIVQPDGMLVVNGDHMEWGELFQIMSNRVARGHSDPMRVVIDDQTELQHLAPLIELCWLTGIREFQVHEPGHAGGFHERRVFVPLVSSVDAGVPPPTECGTFTIKIARQGFWVQGRRVTYDELSQHVSQAAGLSTNLDVMVTWPPGVEYRRLRQIFDLCAENGIDRVNPLGTGSGHTQMQNLPLLSD